MVPFISNTVFTTTGPRAAILYVITSKYEQ